MNQHTTIRTTRDLRRKERQQDIRRKQEQLEHLKRMSKEDEERQATMDEILRSVKSRPLLVSPIHNSIRLLNDSIGRIQELVRIYNSKKQLTHADKQQLYERAEYIVSKQAEKNPAYSELVKRAIRDLRIHEFPVKFSSDYYHFLKKKMFGGKNPQEIIRSYHRVSQQGTAFEAIWTLLISLGFCGRFCPEDYDFYNAELKEPSQKTQYYFIEQVITSAEYLQFLRETPIRGPNGKSDITLRDKTTGEWVFVSCKFYNHEKGDYDISAIQTTIEETIKHHPGLIEKYKIYVFVNDKKKAQTSIKNKYKNLLKNNITTDGVYNILGMEDLEMCFDRFKDMTHNMSWSEFEKRYVKRYRRHEGQDLPSLELRQDQNFIVSRTYSIIYENISGNKCRTRTRQSSQDQPNLRIFWETIPQFGKTYCVGALLHKMFKDIPKVFRKSSLYFNSVIVVDNLEVARKYSDEVFGAHRGLADDFHTTIVKKRKKPDTIVDYMRLTPEQKVFHILQKNTRTNNVLIVRKEDLDLVYEIKDLFLIVFDVDTGGEMFFENFRNSPHRIGLFLSDRKAPTQTGCEYVLKWNENDAKTLQRIYRSSASQAQKKEKSWIQRKKLMYGQRPVSRLISSAGACLRSQVHILSNFLDRSSGPLLEKIEQTLKVIQQKKQGETMSFSTQFWFVDDTETGFQLKKQMNSMDYFKDRFDVAVFQENQGSNRSPGPYKGSPGLLTRHNQKLASSLGKMGLIYMIPVKEAGKLEGISFPNVDTVFSLGTKLGNDPVLLSYAMMAKCRTPKEGKSSVYFVDFNADRVMRLVETYLKGKNVVELTDVSDPDIKTEQILARIPVGKTLQHIIRTIQDKKQKQQTRRVQEQKRRTSGEQESSPARQFVSYQAKSVQLERLSSVAAVRGGSSNSKKELTKQQLHEKSRNQPSYFNSKTKLKLLARSYGISQEEIQAFREKKDLENYLRQNNYLTDTRSYNTKKSS